MGKHDNKKATYIQVKYSKKKGYSLAFGDHKLTEDGPYSEFKNEVFCSRSYSSARRKLVMPQTSSFVGLMATRRRTLSSITCST